MQMILVESIHGFQKRSHSEGYLAERKLLELYNKYDIFKKLAYILAKDL
jgi:hypothetical protein